LTQAGRRSRLRRPATGIKALSRMTETAAICRLCQVNCGIRVTDRVVHIIGDLDNPAYHG
jgi:anaerobic selenocysteine-containing dehydrogenase